MKKWFIIFGILALLTGNITFAYDNNPNIMLKNEKTMFSNYIQLVKQNLKNQQELPSGNLEIYFELKPDFSINTHKIIKYDNLELAEIIDNALKSTEKSYEDFERNNYRYIVKWEIKDRQLKYEIVSRNYPKSKEEAKYLLELNKQLEKNYENIPHENYINLSTVQLELKITKLGKINSIRLLNSSGDKAYDDKLCNYILQQSFGMPPNKILTNGYFSTIIRINPTHKDIIENFTQYSKQISEEIEKQIIVDGNNLIEFYVNKNGNINEVKIYNEFNQIYPEILLSELKNIKISQYPGKIYGDKLPIYYVNKNSNRNIYHYFNKKMMPALSKTLPEINSFKIKPVKCLILMNKSGKLEDITIIKSSGSEQIDKDTINAVRYNSYPAYENAPTEKFAFTTDFYNLNKYLRQYYNKYAKTVASYTLGNVPNIGLHYMRTAKIFFIIKKDGKIKNYTLYDYANNQINEKQVEECLQRLTFPPFPPNIDADELGFYVDLKDPENQIFSNWILYGLSIGSSILYMIAR